MTHALATLAVLLAVSSLSSHCLPAEVTSDCQPELPPNANSSGALLTLQMHQWVWIENITVPDWGPRTEAGGLSYELLKPGVVRTQRLPLLGLRNSVPRIYVNVSYVTGGDTLCAAGLTLYRNQSDEEMDTTKCSRICQANFNIVGTRANLPLLVLDDWTKLSRSTEYLALDAVDPDFRAAYKCMGFFNYYKIAQLPSVMRLEKRCPEGDDCVLNYARLAGVAQAGCKSDFPTKEFCFSDLEGCGDVYIDCNVCCRGDLCNRAVALKVYQKWLEGGGTSSHAASSVWLLAASAALSLLFLLSKN